MQLTLDVENTTIKKDGKMHLDPFEPENKLIMVGCLTDDGEEYLFRMDDDAVSGVLNLSNHSAIQKLLDEATLLICHNAVYDLIWLWECGFKYNKPVFDTMLGDYVLQKGVKKPSSLELCAERYNLNTKKQDTLKQYFKKGIGVDGVPRDELCEYLSSDLKATQELYNEICKRLQDKENSGLWNTVNLTNDVSLTLARIYQRGFSVNLNILEEVRKDFTKEKSEIEEYLKEQVRYFMGDTPINLNSPEQLSWLIYSRKPKNKQDWATHMPTDVYTEGVKEYSEVIFKTKAHQCNSCKGYGKIRKIKKDGKPFAKESRCLNCDAMGYIFVPTSRVAGMRFRAPNEKWLTANGWSTSKIHLSFLAGIAKTRGMKEEEMFLNKVMRLSALDTYLSSFVDGILHNVKSDNKLHVKLLQHRTATGRFSGADPNMQNMPRGGTFPIKKVFVSRWDNGKILEADFAQLEFRTAAYLSQDKTAMKEIEDGFDVHSYTAKIITEGGQKISRQEAKAHTFAPLYGATGFGRTPAEATYYKQFTEKYKGIALWHAKLAKEAVTTGKISTPSGREFVFPEVKRLPNGKVTYFTQIKNFPVQSFATADIVPLILIEIDKRLDNLQSCVVNTVHDSIVIDVHPDEENQIINLIKETNKDMIDLINRNFNIILNVPLVLEAKIGNNWLDMQDVA